VICQQSAVETQDIASQIVDKNPGLESRDFPINSLETQDIASLHFIRRLHTYKIIYPDSLNYIIIQQALVRFVDLR